MCVIRQKKGKMQRNKEKKQHKSEKANMSHRRHSALSIRQTDYHNNKLDIIKRERRRRKKTREPTNENFSSFSSSVHPNSMMEGTSKQKKESV